MKLRVLAACLSFCALLAGCTDSSDGPSGDSTKTTDVSRVTYVCVGMENSYRFGNCPGCKLDSDRMDKLFRNTFGYSGKLFQSSTATRAAVSEAIADAVDSTPTNGLFILYYSGHGGQEYLGNVGTEEPDGADSADEYLCLYDSYLLDDEIWTMVSRCRGRAFLVFDCCHSQTMFRSVASDRILERGLAVPLEQHIVKSTGFSLKPRAVPLAAGGLRMLSWSGCLEKEYSYGSSRGGVMTNSMLSRWRRGMTYSALWALVERDVQKEQPTQHPRATQYGTGFEEAFR